MLIKSLQIVNFRCFGKAMFHFGPGLNLITGPNGSGKTSLLEAITYLSIPRSFRGALDRDLVSWGKDGFFLEGEILRRDVSHSITASLKGETKTVRIDGKRLGTFADLFSTFVVLSVGPTAETLVSGPPAEGRRFLDWALSLMEKEYYQHLLAYRKALSQKNALLKRNGAHLAPWNREMEKHGAFLVNRRERFVKALNDCLPRISRKRVVLVYSPSSRMEVGSLDRVKDLEKQRGFALYGPHRDILSVQVDGRGARHFASQGESRMAHLATILAARDLFQRKLGESPVLVMDEPGAVLDEGHLDALLGSLRGQVIYTDVASRRPQAEVIRLG